MSQERIFGPLGMRETGFELAAGQLERFAAPHSVSHGGMDGSQVFEQGVGECAHQVA